MCSSYAYPRYTLGFLDTIATCLTSIPNSITTCLSDDAVAATLRWNVAEKISGRKTHTDVRPPVPLFWRLMNY